MTLATKPIPEDSIMGSQIRILCGVAAPLVANGGGFVGCSLPKNHEGQHEVTIRWDAR